MIDLISFSLLTYEVDTVLLLFPVEKNEAERVYGL